jgi:integrase
MENTAPSSITTPTTPHLPGQSNIQPTNQHPFKPLPHSQHIIGTHFSPEHPTGFTIHVRQITTTLKDAAKALNLHQHGLRPELISSHSLRAGGATALHLSGCDAKTIQILGRWSSDTFLTYIHHQIVAFSLRLSKHMATHILLHNTHQPHIRPSIGAVQPS